MLKSEVQASQLTNNSPEAVFETAWTGFVFGGSESEGCPGIAATVQMAAEGEWQLVKLAPASLEKLKVLPGPFYILFRNKELHFIEGKWIVRMLPHRS